MKAIITKNNTTRKYDTDTANCIFTWSNDCYASDFNYVCEKLYQKRTKEFFIFGEGGPRTRYCHVCGDGSYAWGSEIIPVSASYAKEWLIDRNAIKEYEALFGEVEDKYSRV